MIGVIPLNWFAILLAAIVQMVVGYLWYSPMLFGATWMKLSGIKMDAKKKMDMTPMVWMFLAALVLAFVLDHSVVYAGAKGFVQGALVGVLSWLGFIATSSAASVLFEKKPFQLYLLNNGHYLVGLALAGAILGHFA